MAPRRPPMGWAWGAVLMNCSFIRQRTVRGMKWDAYHSSACSLAAAAATAAAAAQHCWPSKEAVLLHRHPLPNARQLL